MKPARQRVKKYRSDGGGADLGRVEVLVPPSARELRALYDKALALYRVRILDNVDLDRLPDFRLRAAVIARAMVDRGDARAFAIGRQMLELVGTR